ncbi:MAG: hypothetical protein JRJ75_18150 [Deltaproteobacteria bacterium]|nr:hypothetical protein [Deltaproteobacteria bacterium]MBW1921224.1 hypothetical protein [Deltaproteobacteria bacterium]
MPVSLQFDSIINFAISAFMITGMAVMVSRAIGHHSIPWEDKVRLAEKYGKWAVNRAEAFCPENDVACVEREAKRLLEVYRYRREV